MANLKVNTEMGHGTLKAVSSHDPETDAQVLRKAMKGLGMGYTRVQNIIQHIYFIWPSNSI